jgi:hypothetical protein
VTDEEREVVDAAAWLVSAWGTGEDDGTLRVILQAAVYEWWASPGVDWPPAFD